MLATAVTRAREKAIILRLFTKGVTRGVPLGTTDDASYDVVNTSEMPKLKRRNGR